jgi:hypothetical protein
MRPVSLTTLKGGINRLRVKGGASAAVLYDLLNGYITQAGSITQREGTIRAATLTSQTVGLMANEGVFNVFSTTLQSVPSGYQDNLLVNPVTPSATLTKIWFAQPFMGFPYVVAQFSDGSVFHYWLQFSGTWAPNTVYKTGAIILPLTTQTGLAYLAVRDLKLNPTWTPQTTIALNQIVEPTQYTGYAYKAIAVEGTSPHTGSTEPVWPIVELATIQEFGDFDTTSSDSGVTLPPAGSGTQPLGSSITDRYGDSSEIAGQTGTVGTVNPSITASTTVTTWAPGTLYAQGAVVQPSTGQGAFINAIPNGDFEAGNDGNWVFSHSNVTIEGSKPYQGSFDVQFALGPGEGVETATMFNFGVVTPGQSVTATAYFNPNNSGAATTMTLILNWYNSSDTLLSQTMGAGQEGGGYRQTSVTGIAPANAAHVRVQIQSATGTTPNPSYADLVSWNLETPAAISNFLFEAIQATTGTSASTEPVWPTTAGNTVVDGSVTWQAIGTSIITWQAIAIMQSGATEPVWPTSVGLTVSDGNMSWIATDRHIADTNDPNSVAIALGASHVFAGNKDIVSYSAAVDPTDWSSTNNAGYLPTGLNNYGANPVAMLALYRSNLMVFNSGGYQMWQIDPDPANMALLDAEPVGSVYPRAAQSVANDLLFLTEVGVRNLGTVGATANMQVGSTGQPIDPLVKAQLQANIYEPRSLYYPGRGQYWLFFGPQAFVLTINGAGQKTWSRYVFPDTITDWTLNNGILYMRTAGNLVWQFDQNTLVDDFGGANVGFSGVVQWPYLDAGALGINKMLIGLDLVGTGSVTIQIGFNQADPTTFSDSTGFSASLNVTPPYTVAAADLVPEEPLPIPINAPSYTVILTFGPNQVWSWQAANLYLQDARGGGATG